MHSRAVLGTSSQPWTKLVPQVLLLVRVQVLAVVLGRRSRGRPAGSRPCRRPDRRRCRRAWAARNRRCALMSSRGVKYWPAPFGDFGGALGQQPLVDVALHVGLHRRPVLGVDQVHDQPPQRGRVLDLRPGLLEDLAQHPRLLAEFFEDVPVVGLQFVAVPLQQARPAELRRHDGLAVVRRLGQFVGHLQEEQERDLLRVGHVRQAVVPQDVGEVPGFVDDLLGVGAHSDGAM